MVDWDGSNPDIPDDWNESLPPDFDPPDPFFLGRADLLPSGELFANIYADIPQADFSADNITFDNIRALLGLEDEQTWADFSKDLPFGFDGDDPDIRGPFFDEESVNAFINETGLYWADIYYDAEADEYFIDVSY